MGQSAGAPIVLTAPLTESIDHAGFFIQMSLASIPGVDGMGHRQEVPDVARRADRRRMARAGTAPAGLRVLEAVLAREFGADQVVVCYPDQLPQFIGERTRVVAVSTHNPLGTTFAAGVYASIFGSSREPINALYARRMFDTIRACRQRHPLLGHPRRLRRLADRGDRQRTSEFGIDSVVSGRAESRDVIDLFRRALAGEPLPRHARRAPSARRRPAPRAATRARRSASSR